MKTFLAQNKETVKVAGLATVATALVSFSINKMVEVELTFWMLFAILILGVGTFVYMDYRSNAK